MENKLFENKFILFKKKNLYNLQSLNFLEIYFFEKEKYLIYFNIILKVICFTFYWYLIFQY